VSQIFKKEFSYSISQILPLAPEKTFLYFADETRLHDLTPDWMHFQVLSKSNPSLQNGTLIDYHLTLRRIPFHWRSQIEDWYPPGKLRVCAGQRPFRFLQTYPSVRTPAWGTLMTDRVIYRLSGGLFAEKFIQPLVQNNLDRIFSARKVIIAGQFPVIP